MKKSFLAGLKHAEFLRRHWQKKPLLARAALREYAEAVTRDELFDLASRPEIESRIVMRSRSRWRVRHGPFDRNAIRKLPRTGWTLLLQGADHVLPQAARLLREFAFLPYARLDDVMISYAAPGGGVGPHVDSYDVFLVQGAGARRWRLSAQRKLDLVPNAPLKVLRDFRSQREYLAAPGDVLYLPPGWAHDGVALGECITYSVGFRAPAAQELASRFLEFLEDRLKIKGRYADPDLAATRHPGRIPPNLVKHSSKVLERLRWSKGDVAEFLGRHLTEPKASVVFDRPRRALPPRTFERRAQAGGLELTPASRMLFHGRDVFINGEAVKPSAAAARMLNRLADERELVPPIKLDPEACRFLYEWYLAGYISVR